MANNDAGAHYEIIVDGTPRTYRDDPKIALNSAQYLKSKNPKSEVTIRDMRTNVVTSIAWAALFSQHKGSPRIDISDNSGSLGSDRFAREAATPLGSSSHQQRIQNVYQ